MIRSGPSSAVPLLQFVQLLSIFHYSYIKLYIQSENNNKWIVHVQSSLATVITVASIAHGDTFHNACVKQTIFTYPIKILVISTIRRHFICKYFSDSGNVLLDICCYS